MELRRHDVRELCPSRWSSFSPDSLFDIMEFYTCKLDDDCNGTTDEAECHGRMLHSSSLH